MARRLQADLLLDESARNLVSAALRHIRDAEHLGDPNGDYQSLEQAHHLAGYAPECMRKACLGMRWCDKAIGHRFDDASESVLEFALALDPLASRYNVRSIGTRYPEVARWREDVRYERTGATPQAQIEACVSQARAVVSEILFALWADGRIDVEAIL